MHNSAFTPEELAELAAFDAMVDEEPITPEEIEASRIRDRAAKLDRLDHRKKQIAAYKREYYQANREAIAARKREYRTKKKGSQKLQTASCCSTRRSRGELNNTGSASIYDGRTHVNRYQEYQINTLCVVN